MFSFLSVCVYSILLYTKKHQPTRLWSRSLPLSLLLAVCSDIIPIPVCRELCGDSTRSRVTATCHSDFVIQTAQTCKEGIKLNWNIQSESGLCDRLAHKFSGLKSMWSESFTCHWTPIESDVMCLVQIKETGSLYLRYLWPVYKTEMKIIHLSLKGEAMYCSESSG